MSSRSELASPDPLGNGSEDEPAKPPKDDADSKQRFARLIHAEFEWVWRLLRRIGLSPADADDATQQVFLVAARRGAGVPAPRWRAFLYATSVRIAANARRSLRRRRDVASEEALDAVSNAPATDELVEQWRARALLDELLAQLPDELRRVLVLAEIEQLTAQQIAELEAIPAGTVASRLRRARAAFYGLLEQERHRNPFLGGRP